MLVQDGGDEVTLEAAAGRPEIAGVKKASGRTLQP